MWWWCVLEKSEFFWLKYTGFLILHPVFQFKISLGKSHPKNYCDKSCNKWAFSVKAWWRAHQFSSNIFPFQLIVNRSASLTLQTSSFSRFIWCFYGSRDPLSIRRSRAEQTTRKFKKEKKTELWKKNPWVEANLHKVWKVPVTCFQNTFFFFLIKAQIRTTLQKKQEQQVTNPDFHLFHFRIPFWDVEANRSCFIWQLYFFLCFFFESNKDKVSPQNILHDLQKSRRFKVNLQVNISFTAVETFQVNNYI